MIVFSADWHLENYTSFSTTLPNRANSRLWDLVKSLTHIVTFVKERRPQYFMYLGDFLAGMGNAPRDSIHKDVLRAGYGLLHSIAEVCPIHMIPGNHDYYTGGNYLQIFKDIPNVHIHLKPYYYPFKKNMGMLFVPFPATHNKDGGAQWNAWMGEVEDEVKANNWLLTHQGFSGHEFTGWTDATGVVPPPFPFIISGHYHTHMHKDNVLYLGAPYQLTFYEEGQQKGFVVVEDAGDYQTWRFVPNPGPCFCTKHIKTQEEYDQWYTNHSNYKGDVYYRVHIHDLKINIHGDLDHRVDIIMDRVEPVRLPVEDSTPVDVVKDIEAYIAGLSTDLPREDIKDNALRIWSGK